MARILVVDEERVSRAEICELLAGRGYEIREAASAEGSVALLADGEYDLVVSVLHAGDRQVGLEFLEEIERRGLPTEVILLADHGHLESALAAMRRGAYDVLARPAEGDMIVLSVQRALERRRLKRQVRHLSTALKRRYRIEGFVYQSPQMAEILRMLQRISQVDATVLILGESGTGKELISRAIHARSPRKHGPFHVIDCGTIPENLLESELFGHRRGAFTGADSSRRGLFEMAQKGTLLLDEIGEMPFSLQVKLLRVLQEREIRPVGSDRPRGVDVRVLAATNKDLQEEVRLGRFREDLFYRLNVVSLRVPPLRERPDDILPLAEHFLQKHARQMGTPPLRIDPAAASLLERYPWTGNVRELENAMQRAVAFASGEELRPEDLPEPVRGGGDSSLFSAIAQGGTLAEVEKQYILHVLQREGRNRARAATALGIGRNTLWRKLKAYGLEG